MVHEKTLLTVVVLLLFFGMVMVYSSSVAHAFEKYDNPYKLFLRHLVSVAAAFLVLFLASRFDYKRLSQKAVVYQMLLLVLGLLLAVLFFPPVNHVYRWIRIGPLSFQPSEAAKLFLVIFLSYRLTKAEPGKDEKSRLIPSITIFSIIVLMTGIQPDLGTAVLMVLVGTSMLFLSGIAVPSILLFSASSLVVITFFVFNADYRVKRILAFLDPEADPLGVGFQIKQSLIAVSSGGMKGAGSGLLGTGFGESLQKMFFLPEPHTDFIYSIIGEELGFIGSSLVLIAFCVILWRGFRISLRATDSFGRLFAAGLTLSVVVQAFINIGVVLSLLPTKGIPLPFISYGGTSLVVNAAMIGLLMNVASQSRGRARP